MKVRRCFICSALLSNDLNAEIKKEKMRIIVAGGYPDDPETGCAGTIIYVSEKSQHITALYLTLSFNPSC